MLCVDPILVFSSSFTAKETGITRRCLAKDVITMGKLRTFEIFLFHTCSTVEAGQTLNGQLVLECEEDLEVNDITVQCSGKCRVQLLDSGSATPIADVYTGMCAAQEVYVNKSCLCFPPEAASVCPERSHTLTAGQHVFRFSFAIPSSAPNSHEGEHGKIRYVLKAEIRKLWKTLTNTRIFYVRAPFDLNTVCNVASPVERSGQMTVSPWMKGTGKIRARIQLPQRGYTAGQNLPVDVWLQNDSRSTLRKCKLMLKMVSEYKIKTTTFTTDMLLAKTTLEKVPAGQTLDMCDGSLKVPETCPPSHLHGCKLMHTRYYVELLVKPSIFSVQCLRIQLKFLVGTVPVNTEQEPNFQRLFDPPPLYEDLVPPSYEDVVMTSQSDELVLSPYFISTETPDAPTNGAPSRTKNCTPLPATGTDETNHTQTRSRVVTSPVRDVQGHSSEDSYTYNADAYDAASALLAEYQWPFQLVMGNVMR